MLCMGCSEAASRVKYADTELENENLLGKRPTIDDSEQRSDREIIDQEEIKRKNQPYECYDFIDYNKSNPMKKGETVKEFTKIFTDPNNFYTKFLQYNIRKNIKLEESESYEGTMKILDIIYDGVRCRGRGTSIPKVDLCHKARKGAATSLLHYVMKDFSLCKDFATYMGFLLQPDIVNTGLGSKLHHSSLTIDKTNSEQEPKFKFVHRLVLPKNSTN